MPPNFSLLPPLKDDDIPPQKPKILLPQPKKPLPKVRIPIPTISLVKPKPEVTIPIPIPTISLAEDTDYEYDEKENYRLFGLFATLILYFRIALHFVIKNLKKFFGYQAHEPLEYCTVCCEEFPAKRFVTCSSNHRICGKCLRKVARNSAFLSPLNEIVKGFPCSEYNCKEFISYEKCAKVLPRRTRRHIQTKMHEALLKDADVNFEKCQKCDFLAEVEKCDTYAYFKSTSFYKNKVGTKKIFQCPKCSYTFCCKCGIKCDCKHSTQVCNKIPQEKSNRLSEALIHRCNNCRTPFIKSFGCNSMRCKCGTSQCYGCRQTLSWNHSCSRGRMSTAEIHELDLKNVK